MPSHWTQEQDDALLAAVSAGKRVVDAAADMGCSYYSARARLSDLIKKGRMPSRAKPSWKPQAEQLSQLVREGKTDDMIASALGRSAGSVQNFRSRSGLNEAMAPNRTILSPWISENGVLARTLRSAE